MWSSFSRQMEQTKLLVIENKVEFVLLRSVCLFHCQMNADHFTVIFEHFVCKDETKGRAALKQFPCQLSRTSWWEVFLGDTTQKALQKLRE